MIQVVQSHNVVYSHDVQLICKSLPNTTIGPTSSVRFFKFQSVHGLDIVIPCPRDAKLSEGITACWANSGSADKGFVGTKKKENAEIEMSRSTSSSAQIISIHAG